MNIKTNIKIAICFLIFFSSSIPIEAQGRFQRMRIPMGIYNIPVNGAQIAAFCIDGVARVTPGLHDVFTSSSSSLVVKRMKNGIVEEKPAGEVLGTWIESVGLGKSDRLRFKPVDPKDGFSYTLESRGGDAILGGSAEDVEGVLEIVNAKRKQLQKLDAFDNRIKRIFGEESSWYQQVKHNKETDLEWNVSDPSISETAFQELVTRFKDLTAQTLNPFKDSGKWGSREMDPGLIKLYFGQEFTSEQLQQLSILFDLKVGTASGSYDNYLRIRNSGWGTRVSTTKFQKNIELDDLDSYLKSYKKVLIDGPITEELANRLKDNKIKFVSSMDALLDISNNIPVKIKPIIVSSFDPAKIALLFERTDMNAAVKRITTEAQTIPNSSVVETREGLMNALSEVGPNERPVVIFHHGEQGIMFEDPLGLDQIKDGIGCITFNSDLPFRSTDFIDFESVVKAIKKVQTDQELGTITFNSFQEQFSRNYIANMKKKRNRINIIIASSLAAPAGGGYVLYHWCPCEKETITEGEEAVKGCKCSEVDH